MKGWLLTAGGGLFALTLVITALERPVFAQDDTATPETEEIDIQQSYLDALAAELGVTTDELDAAMTAAEIQMIDLWAEQAKERVSQGEALFPDLVGPFGGEGRGRPHIVGGGPGAAGIAGVVRAHAAESLAELATFLGITEEELETELRGGGALLEIAETNGKTYDQLRTYMIEKATERIDERLERSAGESDETTDVDETSASVEVA